MEVRGRKKPVKTRGTTAAIDPVRVIGMHEKEIEVPLATGMHDLASMIVTVIGTAPSASRKKKDGPCEIANGALAEIDTIVDVVCVTRTLQSYFLRFPVLTISF